MSADHYRQLILVPKGGIISILFYFRKKSFEISIMENMSIMYRRIKRCGWV